MGQFFLGFLAAIGLLGTFFIGMSFSEGIAESRAEWVRRETRFQDERLQRLVEDLVDDLADAFKEASQVTSSDASGSKELHVARHSGPSSSAP